MVNKRKYGAALKLLNFSCTAKEFSTLLHDKYILKLFNSEYANAAKAINICIAKKKDILSVINDVISVFFQNYSPPCSGLFLISTYILPLLPLLLYHNPEKILE